MTEITQQQTPGAPQPSAPAANPPPTTLEERTLNVLSEIHAEDAAAKAAAKVASPPPQAAPAGAPPQADQAAAARRERLAAIHAKNRARVDEKHRQAEGDKAARELERVRQELESTKAQGAQLIDPTKLDEAAFLALADRSRVDPQKLAEWMRLRMHAPEHVAERTAETAARRAVDPELASVRAELAEAKRAIQTFAESQRQAAEQAAEQQAAREFCSLAKEQAATAPLAAAFLNQQGEQAFYELATAAAGMVPGADWSGILDQCEELLSNIAPVFGAPHASAPSPGKQPTHLASAPAPTTVTNALAGARTALSADEDWSKLSLDERARRIAEDDSW